MENVLDQLKADGLTVGPVENFDPHACLKELGAAFQHLESALEFLPTEGDRAVIYVAKIKIGKLMAGLLDFITDDDEAEAEAEAEVEADVADVVLHEVGPNE